MMVVVDEAKAVDAYILDGAVRRILRASEGSRIWFVVLSSPGSPTGAFHQICTSGSDRFKVFQLSAYESERVALEQLAEDAAELGEDAPLFIAMNLGEFPAEGEDTLIPLSWVQAAVGRTVEGGEHTLGVDVARFGSDDTALVSLFGRRAEISATFNGRDTTYTAGAISELHEANDYAAIAIDDAGVGGGVTDQLKAGNLRRIRPINFGSASSSPRHINLKAELYFALRAEFEAGFGDRGNKEVGVSIPDVRLLVHQLSCQRYSFDPRQRYKIESHEAMKRRGEKSPDLADALALANWVRKGRGGQRDFSGIRELNAAAVRPRERVHSSIW